MLKSLRLFVAGAALIITTSAQAALSPVAVSILDPVQFPPEDFSITGARLSVFWGKHRNVYGFDIAAIGNKTEQNFGGSAASGVFNLTHGMATVIGVQVAGIANVNAGKSRIFGVQAALVNSNQGEGGGFGAELALANLSPHSSFGGIQAGVYNSADEIYGFQVGLINVVNRLHGIQIGLLNFNKTGIFAVSPIINIGF